MESGRERLIAAYRNIPCTTFRARKEPLLLTTFVGTTSTPTTASYSTRQAPDLGVISPPAATDVPFACLDQTTDGESLVTRSSRSRSELAKSWWSGAGTSLRFSFRLRFSRLCRKLGVEVRPNSALDRSDRPVTPVAVGQRARQSVPPVSASVRWRCQGAAYNVWFQ
jgi:hypothetical protein